MSALVQSPEEQRTLLPMTVGTLDHVLAIEQKAYAFPWTRGNFIDSLHAGYAAWRLQAPAGLLLGYFVAMQGVDEMHLLNITVAPAHQGCGHARFMLDALCDMARHARAEQIWLEVRMSNARAREIYEQYGFRSVGVRKAYYPAVGGTRENALVMSLAL